MFPRSGIHFLLSPQFSFNGTLWIFILIWNNTRLANAATPRNSIFLTAHSSSQTDYEMSECLFGKGRIVSLTSNHLIDLFIHTTANPS